MTLNDYQNTASTFAFYPQDNLGTALGYTVLGLNGEAGEVANNLKKIIRDKENTKVTLEDIMDELGDTLWYVSESLRVLGYTLEDAAQYNIGKLTARQIEREMASNQIGMNI